MNRELLISICESSIVPWNKWNNRDSFVAQQNVNQCYKLLKAGAEYKVSVCLDKLNIDFFNLSSDIIKSSFNFHLSYDNVELYQEENPDTQIFEYYCCCEEKDTEFYCYLPTLEYLEKCDGEDWY